MVPFLMLMLLLMAMMILWVTTISFSDNFAINHICRRGTLYQLHLWHQEGDVDDEENVPRYIKSGKIKVIIIKLVMVALMVMLAIMTRKMLVKIKHICQ